MTTSDTAQDLVARWSDVVVVPVDCFGAMNTELALSLRQRWPHLLDEYRALLALGLLRPGRPQFAHIFDVGWVAATLLFPVKDAWREPARLDFIEAGIDAIPGMVSERVRVDALTVPRLSYGQAGDDWGPLFNRIQKRLPGQTTVRHTAVSGDLPEEAPVPGPGAEDPELVRIAALLERLSVAAATLSRPCPTAEPDMLRLWVRTKDWLDVWHRLRNAVDVTGLWPVMLGGPGTAYEELQDIETEGADAAGQMPTPQTIVLEALATDAGAWLREKSAIQRMSGWDGHDPLECPEEWDVAQEPLRRFREPQDIGVMVPPKMVALALLPTQAGWEAPAYLRFYAHNYEYPLPPADHVRLMASWWDRFGAEPALIWRGEKVVEFHVTRPPRDRAASLSLAEEHFVYCSDRVGQEASSIEALAAQLLDAPVWHFWWD
jgi:hypothetical protein